MPLALEMKGGGANACFSLECHLRREQQSVLIPNCASNHMSGHHASQLPASHGCHYCKTTVITDCYASPYGVRTPSCSARGGTPTSEITHQLHVQAASQDVSHHKTRNDGSTMGCIDNQTDFRWAVDTYGSVIVMPHHPCEISYLQQKETHPLGRQQANCRFYSSAPLGCVCNWTGCTTKTLPLFTLPLLDSSQTTKTLASNRIAAYKYTVRTTTRPKRKHAVQHEGKSCVPWCK